MEKITSRKNPICVHVKKLGTSKSYREEEGQFISDGEKLLSEAVSYGADIEIVLTAAVLPFDLPDNTRVYQAENSLIDSISPLRNSQGLLFTCRIPKICDCDYHTGIHVLLDGIQDPGNVGTIIRSAGAFGIQSVLLSEGSADPYNPKAIRASMGAIFKQHHRTIKLDEIQKLKQKGAKLIGASNDRNCIEVTKADLENSIIVLGSEGQGISDSIFELCDEMITIPLSPDCESLNVAAAASIIMWEASLNKFKQGLGNRD